MTLPAEVESDYLLGSMTAIDKPSTLRVDATPWERRTSAMPWIPGSPSQVIPRLARVLEQIQSGTSIDAQLEWPDGDGHSTIRATVRGLGKAIFYERDKNGSLQLSNESKKWLINQDSIELMLIFHRRVRFFSELLHEVAGGAATHEELRTAAAARYGQLWESHDQVRRRTSWMRAAGLVELWSTNEIHLTIAGQDFLGSVEVSEANTVGSFAANERSSTEITLEPPGPRVSTELERLDQESLRNRKRAISFIPGGDPIDVIQQLVSLAESPISRERFEELCSAEFSISPSSANMSLSALRSANLLKQTGPSTFEVSELAREWLESDNPLALIRIFHASFIAFGELLELMDEPSSAADLSRRMETELGVSRLSKEEVARRLRLLESAGLVYRITQVSCQRTALGTTFVDTIPKLNRNPYKHNHDTVAESRDTDDDAQFIIAELIKGSTNTSETVLFERAIASTLSHLGFAAQHLGGPSRTDVLVEAWLGPGKSRTVAIDAKTAASGIKDSIEFNILREHRKRHNASISVVVAPGFDARLASWARDEGVALLTAQQLADIVRWQKDYPIPVADLARIFDVDGLSELADRWASVKRQQEILSEVIARMWKTGNSTGHIQASGGALSARDLWLMMLTDESAASQEEISDALHFLASPMIGAVEARKNDVYVATSPPQALMSRLAALRSAIGGSPSYDLNSESTRSTDRNSYPRPLSENVSTNDSGLRPPGSDIDPAVVRRWAARNGIPVSPRGRLPSHIKDQYFAATSSGLENTTRELKDNPNLCRDPAE